MRCQLAFLRYLPQPMQFHHDAVQFRFDCRCTHTSEEIQEKGHHGYGIVCDTQSPNGTLLAVQDTNAAAQKQRSDHKAKSSVDMQYRKQEGRNQDRIKAGVFAFENADQALMYGNPEWEKLSIFLNMLIPKLPSPQEDDLSQGILDAIDLDSYRVEKRETISLILPDEDAEVLPVPTSIAKGKQEPELDVLSAILSDFNDMFGNIDWNDADNVRRQILEIPGMVSRDEQYQNAMRNSDKQEARTESDRVLQKVIFSIMADNMELFKQYTDNKDFKKWLSDLVFNVTYNKSGTPYTGKSV